MRRKLSLSGIWIVVILIVCLLAVLLIHLPFHAHADGGTWQEYTYSGPSGSRPYFVYTPVNYQAGQAVPLLVMLHGCTQTPADFAAGTRVNELADQEHFIVVYPQQTSQYQPYNCWSWYDSANQARGSGEPAIIAGIVQTVEQDATQWTIASKHIYVAGISAGAAMSVILGVTYPDIFAAVGISSGVEYQAATTPEEAPTAMQQGGPDPLQQGQVAYNVMGSLARVVPTIVFHGSSDPIIKPVNGDQVVQQEMQTDHLASHGTYNADFQHPSSTTTSQVPSGHSYTESTWDDDNGNTIQQYWLISGMGHAWSGGSQGHSYTDPQGPDESQAMVAFFLHYAR